MTQDSPDIPRQDPESMNEKPAGTVKKNLSLRFLLVLLAVMTATPSLLVLGLLGFNGRILAGSLVSASAVDFSSGIAFSFALTDDLATSYMQRLREQPPIVALDYARCNRIFRERIAQDHLFDDILLATAAGDVLASGKTDAPASIAPLLDTATSSNDKIYRAEMYRAAPYEEGVIPYVQGLHPDSHGNPQFVLVLLLHRAAYGSVQGKIAPPENVAYSLLDRTGHFILRYPDTGFASVGEQIDPGLWKQLKNGGSHGSLSVDDSSGQPRYFGYTKLKGENESEPYMIALAAPPRNEASASFTRAAGKSTSIALLGVLCASAAALYLSQRYIVRPLKKLAFVTQKFADGDLSQRVEDSDYFGEIALLARTFDEMALTIQQRARLGRSIAVEVREQANKDFLTGAFNRRAGLSILGNTRRLSLDSHYPFSIIFIDLDRFKSINDTYGHAEGDTLLECFSALLTNHLRADDILCRYGGDEFLIVLPHCDQKGVDEAWTRIQESLARLNEKKTFKYAISLSHGTAVFDPEHPVSLEELIDIADKRMYLEKENKREAFKEQDGR